jgi:hypothetical protein
MDDGFDFGYSERRQKSSPPPQPLEPAPSGYLGRKRTHSHMELESSPSPPWDFFHDDFTLRSEPNNDRRHPRVSGLHLSSLPNMPPTQPRRFAGDGLDYRRPVSSTTRRPSQAAIIDLTDDDPATPASNTRPAVEGWQRSYGAQRLPRSEREIIHLDDDDDVQQLQPPSGPSESPDVQFISSRTRDRDRPNPSASHNNTSTTDDVQFVRSNTRPTTPGHWTAMTLAWELADGRNQLAHLRHHLERMTNMRAPLVPPRAVNVGRRGRGNGAPPSIVGVGALPPRGMDYGTVGFEVATGAPAPAAAPPTYSAPPPAPEGFTRSPTDEGPLICPNCDNELCVGESELQRQVWIIKSCGHVRAPLLVRSVR